MVVKALGYNYIKGRLYVVGVLRRFIRTVQQYSAPERHAARTKSRIEASLEKPERNSMFEEYDLSNTVAYPFSNVDGTGV